MNALRVYGMEHKDRLKAYYENHKDEFAERHRKYYEKNKNKILSTRKQKMTCDCGSEIRCGDLARHLRTKKHQDLINNK